MLQNGGQSENGRPENIFNATIGFAGTEIGRTYVLHYVIRLKLNFRQIWTAIFKNGRHLGPKG